MALSRPSFLEARSNISLSYVLRVISRYTLTDATWKEEQGLALRHNGAARWGGVAKHLSNAVRASLRLHVLLRVPV
jgi:hypothetical protein